MVLPKWFVPGLVIALGLATASPGSAGSMPGSRGLSEAVLQAGHGGGGAFASETEAHEWARKAAGGKPYVVFYRPYDPAYPKVAAGWYYSF
jgi:hypothetical protein